MKNLILDMAKRLHSDVALTCAHWGGMSPTACSFSFSLLSSSALGPRDANQLGLQLSPTRSFLPFHQLLPAPGVAPCRDTTHSPMPGLGSSSPSALASCPVSISSCMVSSKTSIFAAVLSFILSHTLNLTKSVLNKVRNWFWSVIPFCGGFGLLLLWPEHIQGSTLHVYRDGQTPQPPICSHNTGRSRQQHLA